MKLRTFVSSALLSCLIPGLALGQADTLTSRAQVADSCGFEQARQEVASTPVCADGPPACYPQWLALDQKMQAAIRCRMKALAPEGKGLVSSNSTTLSAPQ